MPAFKFTLFDEEERKQLEGMLVSALVRVVRILIKDGTLQLGGAAPAARPAVATPAAEAPAVRPAPPPTSTWPMPAPEPEPSSSREKVPVVPPHLVAQAPPKKERRNLRKIIETVGHRPHGWIDRTEAIEILGGDSSAESTMSTWILNKEVPACIVANAKPPNKGLPGRVHVDKDALLKRNERRIENAKNPLYHWREKRKQA